MRAQTMVLVLALMVGGPAAVRGQDTSSDDSLPDGTATTSELRERTKRSLDQAKALHEDALRLRQESNRREEQAEQRRAEATRLQAELASRDQKAGAERLRALALRRDADEAELLAAAADRNSSELAVRAQRMRAEAKDQRSLAATRGRMADREKDETRRSRLAFQSKFLSEEAARMDAEATQLERDSKDAAGRGKRFRDDARKNREEADRIEARVGPDDEHRDEQPLDDRRREPRPLDDRRRDERPRDERPRDDRPR